MINFPLTSNEEKELREVKQQVQAIDINHSNPDNIEIYISKHNRETWLNILSMAERGNEILTHSWRNSGSKGNATL